MYSLRSVDVMSCAKITGALYFCIGLVLLPFLLLAGLAGLAAGQHEAALSGIGMLIMAVLAPLLYGAMGFLVGALMAWLYNVISRRVGGIRLELQAEMPAATPALS